LWRSDPVLANLDGLIDHGEDYTDAAMVPDTLKTAYQVGKGILRQLAEADPTPEPEAAEDPQAAMVTAETATTAPQADRDAAPLQAAAPAPVADPAPEQPRPRRMAFRAG
jgi:hypothetical protein